MPIDDTPPSAHEKVTGPLAGYRIIEIGGRVSAFTGRLLAWLGAEIIKVEPPQGSAERRSEPLLSNSPGQESGIPFLYLNPNKLSVTLDILTPKGLSLLHRLLETADALVCDDDPLVELPPNLILAELEERFPSLIVTTISPYGSTGPWAERSGTDLTLLARGGFLALCGYPDGPPVRPPGEQAFQAASAYAAIATLLGLLARNRIGHGQQIEISMQEAVTTLTETPILFYQYHGGAQVQRLGAHHPALPAPGAIFRTRDGYSVRLAVETQTRPETWNVIAGWLKHDRMDEPDDDQYYDRLTRALDAVKINRRFAAWLQRRTLAEFSEEAQKHDILFSVLADVDDAVNNEQLQAREFMLDVHDPALGRPVSVPGLPFRFEHAAVTASVHAPHLGEHTELLLRQLGISQEELADLRSKGVI